MPLRGKWKPFYKLYLSKDFVSWCVLVKMQPNMTTIRMLVRAVVFIALTVHRTSPRAFTVRQNAGIQNALCSLAFWVHERDSATASLGRQRNPFYVLISSFYIFWFRKRMFTSAWLLVTQSFYHRNGPCSCQLLSLGYSYKRKISQ